MLPEDEPVGFERILVARDVDNLLPIGGRTCHRKALRRDPNRYHRSRARPPLRYGAATTARDLCRENVQPSQNGTGSEALGLREDAKERRSVFL